METIAYREKLKSQIKDAYGKVLYTYTAHHKFAARLIKQKNTIKVIQITLTAISTVGFLATIITNQVLISWLGGTTAALSLGLNLYTKDFNLQEDIQKHKDAADDLWDVREKYLSLLTDFDILNEDNIREQRDKLQDAVSKINRKYPGTDGKSYAAAQNALQNEEEQTFREGEVDELLPNRLRDSEIE